MTKRDAVEHLKADLQKLIQTVSPEEQENARQNFDGFLKLYEKFLKQDATTVNWNKIDKLPDDAVCIIV